MPASTIRRLNLGGWTLFVLSALFFMLSTARAGDWIGLAASLLFLIACFLFMAPLLKTPSIAPGDAP